MYLSQQGSAVKGSPFPFFTSSKPVTYTELRSICDNKYRLYGQGLIEGMRQSLEAFRQAQDKRQALEALLLLEKQSLEISCLNNAWIDFSNAVFEVLVLPPKHGKRLKVHAALCEVMQQTLKRLGA